MSGSQKFSLLFLGALLFCTSSYSAVKESEPRQGHITVSDDVQIFYRITGHGTDTIILLHGGPGLDMGYLAPDLEPLGEHFTLIFYDQRGSGRSTLVSEPDKVHIDAHVEDLEGLRRYFGLNTAKLLGHSWGALLAAAYLRVYPDNVSHVVMSSPAPLRRIPYFSMLGPHLRRWMDETVLAELEVRNAARNDPSVDAQDACRAYWSLLIAGYFADPFDATVIGRMRGDFCDTSVESLQNRSLVNRLTWESIGEWDWREDFSELQIPVLVITGTDDIFPTEAMEEWHDAFPGSQLVLIERAGHYPQIERPEVYFPAVTEFLTTIGS